MAASIRRRMKNSTLRNLEVMSTSNMVDFLSNDYLGMSTLQLEDNETTTTVRHGSTGSRLLSGNTLSHTSLENYISNLHTGFPSNALLFNSGYTANLSVFGCIPREGDNVIMDEEVRVVRTV
eukprot:CAMPEP_0118653610 /NCGR_PEP_ID=MMETSP0785-20121206/11918_1 /TAXON_ID=91992 /ORGANISM="Bolidomonas pacifica, Strain CCMP 1866" /LENGTH=121 /DNA_ID=CAMNT_0006546155 /DNA_START=193 /DNA_END=558 /DNA_ORIENTATION=-